MDNNTEIHHSQDTIRECIQKVSTEIGKFSDTPLLDARVLLTYVTGQPHSWLLAHPEATLTPVQQEKLQKDLTQLKSNIPLPYIIGHWEFFGLDFEVNPHVLIPRPETELLVEQAIQWFTDHPTHRRAVDVGTGSGCIAVTLAKHLPDLQLTAIDISENALETARKNAKKHGVVHQIEFKKNHLLSHASVSQNPFSAIFANLPYIPTQTLKQLDVFGQEPTLALDGGPDGLSLIRELLSTARQYLTADGLLLLEIESTQGESAIKFVCQHFPDADIDLLQDLAGHDRLLKIQL